MPCNLLLSINILTAIWFQLQLLKLKCYQIFLNSNKCSVYGCLFFIEQIKALNISLPPYTLPISILSVQEIKCLPDSQTLKENLRITRISAHGGSMA